MCNWLGRYPMRLLGHYLSPFTRRVGVSLHAVGLAFSLEEVSVVLEPDRVRPFNPLLRIPTLVLDSGEPLIESDAILDEIDQLVGPERALIPASGPPRRRVMQLTALALGSMDKAQWGYYERRFHPPEKVHQPWIDHNDRQCLGGLQRLEAVAADLDGAAWMAGTTTPTQADITAGVVISWMREARPELGLEQIAPDLCRFADRAERLDCFLRAPMPASAPGRPGVWLPPGQRAS